MSDPSSFLSITVLLRISFSASDICGDFPPQVDGTVSTGDTILYNKRQQSDVIQSFKCDLNTRKEREIPREYMM
jgi:hypothetical protein